MLKLLSVLLFSTLILWAENVDEIIKKMEKNNRGTNVSQTITMNIQTSRELRTMKLRSWSMGTEKSFILLEYPKKDKGITFLKIDKQMWQYIPRIEKIIKIPASMMMQSWMGSDFSNDDMVKESSMTDDYTHKLIKEDDKTYTIELIPLENAAVVWGKVVVVVQKKTYAALSIDYYDEENILERSLYFEDIRLIDGLYFAHKMIMQPQTESKKKNITTVLLTDVKLNAKLDESMFTKNALKRLSR